MRILVQTDSGFGFSDGRSSKVEPVGVRDADRFVAAGGAVSRELATDLDALLYWDTTHASELSIGKDADGFKVVGSSGDRWTSDPFAVWHLAVKGSEISGPARTALESALAPWGLSPRGSVADMFLRLALNMRQVHDGLAKSLVSALEMESQLVPVPTTTVTDLDEARGELQAIANLVINDESSLDTLDDLIKRLLSRMQGWIDLATRNFQAMDPEA